MDNKQEVRSPFQWRDNTLTERRRMRNDRKKKKRLQSRRGHRKSKADAVIEGLAARLQKESQQRERLLFLARKYYEKWKQNKVIMKSPREDTMKLPSFSRFGTRAKIFSLHGTGENSKVSDIAWNQLMSPKDKDGNETNIQLGEGVFGQCLKKYYKGIPVAVKLFNHLSSSQDVKQEANIMAQCSHPSIPHIFGVNVTRKPYFLVSYSYALGNSSCTLFRALHSKSMFLSTCTCGKIMLGLCEALEHLHSKHILHRDIKSDNILLTEVSSKYHPMLIDFGKSIQLSEAPSKRKCLTAFQQEEYRKKHRHVAPEVVLGQAPSFASDMFSFGMVMADVSSKVKMESHFMEGQNQCLVQDPKLRCTVSYLLSQLRK